MFPSLGLEEVRDTLTVLLVSLSEPNAERRKGTEENDLELGVESKKIYRELPSTDCTGVNGGQGANFACNVICLSSWTS